MSSAKAADPKSKRVVLASIAKAHGVRGAVRAMVFNPDSELLVPGQKLHYDMPDGVRTLTIADLAEAEPTWVFQFEELHSRDDAELLRGKELWVAREALPPLEPGEYYLVDVPGCAVNDPSGARWGEVVGVFEYPSCDVFVVRTNDGKEVEVPVVDGYVLSVDTEARLVVVDPSPLSEG